MQDDDKQADDSPLTVAERRTVDAAKKRGHTEERAKFWGCKIRTMQIMIADGVPVDSSAEMVKWWGRLQPAARAKLHPDFQRRLAEERALLEGRTIGDAGKPSDLVAEFAKEYKPDSDVEKDNLADIKRERAFYLFQLRKARESEDAVSEAAAAKNFLLFSNVVHDCELRAQKLGRDMGDLVPRADLELPARFLAYHLLRCADAALNDLVATLTKMNPDGKPLTAEQIRAAGEPILLTALILKPMERAMQGDNSAAPPGWLVAAMKEGIAEVIET